MLNPNNVAIDLSYTQNAPYATGIVESGLAVFTLIHERFPQIAAIVTDSHPIPNKIPSDANLVTIHGEVGSKEYWASLDALLETKEAVFFPYQVLDHKFPKTACYLFFTYHDITPLTEWRFCGLNHREIQYCATLKKKVFYFAKQLIRLFGHIYRKRKSVMKHNLEIADAIFAVSNSTRSDVIKAFKVKDESKIITIYGPRKTRKKSTDKPTISYKDFFLLVSTNRYLKNSIPAIKALNILWASGDKRKALLTGNPSKKLLKNAKFPEMVVPMAYLSDTDLDYLYENASVFIFPSASEGLGMPPLEALAYGTKTVCSNAMSLGEIYGDLPTFDPYDVKQIVAAIKKADELPKSFFADAHEAIAKRTEYKLDLVIDTLLKTNEK